MTEQQTKSSAPASPQAEYEDLQQRAAAGQLHPQDFQRLEQLRPHVEQAAAR